MEQGKELKTIENETENSDIDMPEMDPREIARLMVLQAIKERARSGDPEAPDVSAILKRMMNDIPTDEAAETKSSAEEAAKEVDTQEIEEAGAKGEPNKRVRPKRSVADALTNAFAAPIILHDKIQYKFDSVMLNFGRSLLTEYHNMRERYKHTSKQMLQSIFSMLVTVCILLLIFEHNTVYEYAYNGRVLGYVKSQETVNSVLTVASEEMTAANDVSVDFEQNDNITFKKVSSELKDQDTADQVVNKLTYMTEIEVKASGIFENGNLIMVVENETAAKNVMNAVLQNYNKPDDGMQVTELTFSKEITIEPVEVMIPSVNSFRQATEKLVNGGNFSIKHIVKEEETVETMAETYSVSQSDIRNDSGEESGVEIEPGDIVSIEKHIEPMSVTMTESGTMTESIEFKTEEKKSADLYIGDTEVQQEGQDGKILIKGSITFVNGEESDRNIEESEVIKEAVTEIILIGTTERPKTAPTGTFVIPIHNNYALTSGFGSRWGSFHKGIDMACPTGTPVYASDGGTVIRASWFTGYGNCIDVEHENGTYTRYGHLSGYAVSAGDKVYQGQEIGYVGNTGWSTGSHLHFEIHMNGGDPIDPAPHLGLPSVAG